MSIFKDKKFKGEKYIDKDGYIMVRKPIDENPLFNPMYKARGYGYEHRILMAKHLGRVLDKHEHVNHIDKNRQNNLLKNLKLLDGLAHLKEHRNKGDFKLFTSTYNPSLKKSKKKLELLSKTDPKELAKGIKVEQEHKDTVGPNPMVHANIALDHLDEDPKYYTKLIKMEKKTSLQKNAAGMFGNMSKFVGDKFFNLGTKANSILDKTTTKGFKIFSPETNNKLINKFNTTKNYIKTNPAGSISTLGGVATGIAGALTGLAQDPGRDENGNKKSRFGNIARNALIGGGVGYGISKIPAVGKQFTQGFKTTVVPKQTLLLGNKNY